MNDKTHNGHKLDRFTTHLKTCHKDLEPGPWSVNVVRDVDRVRVFIVAKSQKVVSSLVLRPKDDVDHVIRHMMAMCYLRNQLTRTMAVIDILRVQQAMRVPFDQVLAEADRQVELPEEAFLY